MSYLLELEGDGNQVRNGNIVGLQTETTRHGKGLCLDEGHVVGKTHADRHTSWLQVGVLVLVVTIHRLYGPESTTTKTPS